MFNKDTYNQKMQKTLEVFNKELGSLRTGRANANMLDLTKNDVAKVFGVSTVTVAKTYKQLIPYEEILFKSKVCDKIKIMIKNYRKHVSLPPELARKLKQIKKM